MPTIKPISDLRNYSAVLQDVAFGAPVYLTKNGRGCYAIVDIAEQGWLSSDDVREHFRRKANG